MCDRCVFSHIKLNECHHYPACLIAGIIQHDNLEKHKMTTSDEWFKLDCVLKKFRLSLFIIIFFLLQYVDIYVGFYNILAHWTFEKLHTCLFNLSANNVH